MEKLVYLRQISTLKLEIMKKSRLFRFFALVAAMLCALGMQAVEAYACYTESNTTLAFYYDDLRSTRPGTTYDAYNWPNWYSDGTNANVTKVVFDSSFANARPTATNHWFHGMVNLESITGMEYLNTSEVTDMSMMFSSCKKLVSLDVSHFNTAKVTDMSTMFRSCNLLTSLDVSSFNTAQVTTMEAMFEDCCVLTSLDLSHFNTSNVTNMRAMFNICEALTSLNVSHFNTAQVTDMSDMFCDCCVLTSLDVSSFNTANVTYMQRMFSSCKSLMSLDLSSFNTSKVTEMWWMFMNCPQLETIYVGDGWSTAAVVNSFNMFLLCTSLVGGQGTTYDASHVDVAYAHIDGGPSNPGYFTEKPIGLLGDVNGDGNVNITDVTVLITAVMRENYSDIITANADMNGDSIINITDVTMLIYIVMAN